MITTATAHAPAQRPRRSQRPQSAFVIFVIFVSFVIGACNRDRRLGPIVLISIDTLRADHLPAYGYTKVRTPNIDALAAGGRALRQNGVPAPQTVPRPHPTLTRHLPLHQRGPRHP